MFLHTYLPSSVFFTLGPLSFHWYGLLMSVAIVVGYLLVRKSAARQGKSPLVIDSLVVWLVVGGLIGARLFDAFFYEWWYFKNNPLEIFAFWQPGLSWHGALLGGLVALWWWNKRRRESIINILGMLVPALALGQALGRFGNYFNQELYGLPTNLPWGIPISPELRPLEYLTSPYFQPVFLYEFAGLVLIFIFLWHRRHQASGGQQLAGYLILTGLLRFAMEWLRLDSQPILLGLRMGMWLALLSIVVGLYLWFISRPRFSSA
ncbi:MAG: prolipoprotein diacylglyceryl transferase [Candidatus Kerfeldbacteria bacterium]|nr:prolipoprotein diacylglyceryl transferase [Candidatus Kerfeldbacteria bacterium]